MKNKLLISGLVLLTSSFAISCNHQHDLKPTDKDEFIAYVSSPFNASFGKEGTFSISPGFGYYFEENIELDSFVLGGAFANMEVKDFNIAKSEDGTYQDTLTLLVEGVLGTDSYGTVSGKGIIKGENISLNVGIEEAMAEVSSPLYSGNDINEVKVNLINACFMQEVKPAHFTFNDPNLTVKEAKIIDFDEEGYEENMLPSTVFLKVEGKLDETLDLLLSISSEGTNYFANIETNVSYLFQGADLLNTEIDTFNLKDTLLFEAKNITFNEKINPSDISFKGALQDYARIDSLEVVDKNHLQMNLSFPFDFVAKNDENNIGYITFNENTNLEKVSFEITTIILEPLFEETLEVLNDKIQIKIKVENEEFDDPSGMRLKANDGEKDLELSNVKIAKENNELTITFDKLDNVTGLVKFTLENAYSSLSEGNIKTPQNLFMHFNF